MIEAIFFDLDGTLADTAPDLALAINQVLVNHGKKELAYEKIRPYVSGGSPALIKLGFGIDETNKDFATLKQQFLSCYQKNLVIKTTLFDGISRCVNTLINRNIVWGIITNKPEFLTTPLIKKLKLLSRAAVIISGDTYLKKKPDPYPLIQACKLTNTCPNNTIYIGDDERDMIAAKAANMISVCANWGYLSEQDSTKWKAHYYIEKSTQLELFLNNLLDLS